VTRVVHLCASCTKPIVWLNNEPYSEDEIEQFAMRCDHCHGATHSDCAEPPHAEWEIDYAWLCGRCHSDFDTAFYRNGQRGLTRATIRDATAKFCYNEGLN
jgi:DNA-directed RNA polymerase subunit RPC12/RpoP